MTKPIGMLFAPPQVLANAYPPPVRARLAEKLDMLPECAGMDTLRAEDARRIHILFSSWGMPALTEAQIREVFPALRAVFYAAGSVQRFAQPFLDCGVQIFSAWAANAVPVAEVAASEILLANKGFFQTVHRGGSSLWAERTCGAPYPGNYGTAVGILGAGQIGRRVIGLLRRHALRLYVYDPFLSADDADALGAEKLTDVCEVFRRCQTVSNHLADKPETAGLLDRTCFEAMAPNGVFLNTGRGRQVVEADLIAALKAVPTRAAVLDVTYPEPPQAGSELYTLPNVFLTPHMAGSIGDEIGRMGEWMAEECFAFLEGRPTRSAVTREMLRTMA